MWELMLKQEFSCAFQDVCRIDSLTRRWLKDFQQSLYKNFYSPRFCQKCRLKKCLKVLSFCVSNLLVRSNWYLTRLGWKGNGSWARGRRKGEAAEKQRGRPHHPHHHCPHHHRPHQIHLLQSRSILAGRGHRQQSNQAGERQVRTKWKMRTGRMNRKGVFFFSLFFQCQCFPVWPRWLRWRSELSTRYQVWERWSGGKGNFKCWRYFVSIL